jgi:hypothetical protein
VTSRGDLAPPPDGDMVPGAGGHGAGRGGRFFNHIAWAGTLSKGAMPGQSGRDGAARPPARVWPPWLPAQARTPVKEPPATRFFAHRVFGPERRALLTAQLPASEADAAAHRATQRTALIKELARIDIAQRNQILQIDGLSPDPADKAAQAMRARCSQRFTELHTERETIETQITALDATPASDDHAELLDALRSCPGTSASSPNASRPPSTKHSTCSCSTTRTSTRSPYGPPSPPAPPHAVAAIMTDAGHDPANTSSPSPSPSPPPPASPAMSALTQRPI